MEKLLIVDDDEDLLEMITMMLEANRFQVSKLSDASCLIEVLDREKPDLIILDIFMGAIDVRELCKLLKNTEQYSRIPIILYSAGHISQSSIAESKADIFLPKPFEMAELVKVVRRALDDSAKGKVAVSNT